MSSCLSNVEHRSGHASHFDKIDKPVATVVGHEFSDGVDAAFELVSDSLSSFKVTSSMKHDRILSKASESSLVHDSSAMELCESTPFAHVSVQPESFSSSQDSQVIGNFDLMRSDMIKLAIGPTSNSALPCPRLCGASFCGGTLVFFCNLKTTVSIGLGSTNSSSQTVMKPVMTLFDSSFNFPSAMEWVSDGNQAKQAIVDAKEQIPRTYAQLMVHLKQVSDREFESRQMNSVFHPPIVAPISEPIFSSVLSPSKGDSQISIISSEHCVENRSKSVASISEQRFSQAEHISFFENYFFDSTEKFEISDDVVIGVDFDLNLTHHEPDSDEATPFESLPVDSDPVLNLTAPDDPKSADFVEVAHHRIKIPRSALILFSVSNANLEAEVSRRYQLHGRNASDLCIRNRDVALQLERNEIACIWHLASVITRIELSTSDQGGLPWAHSPLGGGLARKLLTRARMTSDFQAFALLTCIFSFSPELGGVLYSTEEHELIWYHAAFCSGVAKLQPELVLEKQYHDAVRFEYAEFLYSIGNLTRRNEVMKFVHSAPPEFPSFTPGAESPVFDVGPDAHAQKIQSQFAKNSIFLTDLRFVHASNSRSESSVALHCSVCRCLVPGLSTFCENCNHGGHASHINAWFLQNPYCPTGCGCRCNDHITILSKHTSIALIDSDGAESSNEYQDMDVNVGMHLRYRDRYRLYDEMNSNSRSTSNLI